MLKSFAMFLLVGAASGLTLETARACGGGCGMSGGGGYYGGGRAVASRKALGGGANLAQARPQAVRPASPVAPAQRALAARPVTTAAKTVAVTKGKVSAKAAQKKPIYTCPMHPQIQWTSAVDCPICGMKLKPKAAKKSAQDEAPMPADEHAGMERMSDMDQGMADMEGMQGMEGMDDLMMCCPGCMGMGGMSGMNGGKSSPKASGKPTSRGGSMGAMAGMGCGC